MVRRSKTKHVPVEFQVAEPPDESEDILHAIRAGEVDAFVVNKEGEAQVLTLSGAHKSLLALLDQVKEGVITVSEGGLITYAGTRVSYMLKSTIGALLGKPLEAYVEKSQRKKFHEYLKKALAGEIEEEFELQTSDTAAPFPVILKGRGFEIDKENRAAGIVITDLKEERILEKLRASEERYRYAAKAANEVIWEWEIDSGALRINPAMTEAFGWGEEPRDIAWWKERIHPGDRERIEREIEEAFDSGQERWESSFLFQTASASYAFIFNRAYILRRSDGSPAKAIGAMLDLSERHRHEQALKDLNQRLEQRVDESTKTIRSHASQLRRLAHEQTKIVHRERKKIAELLHNDLQQILVSVVMRLALANRGNKNKEAAENVEAAQNLVQKAIETMRLLTTEIYPAILHHGTLRETLAWIAANMKTQYNLDVKLDFPMPIEAPDEIKYLLFESVRELLFNVVKHSCVKQAEVGVALSDDGLRVSVADRGRGCDGRAYDMKTLSTAGNRFGLLSVKERIKNYGGTLEIRTELGSGFESEIQIPADCLQKEALMPPETASPPNASGPASMEFRQDQPVIQVVVVDDHQLVREGIVNILQAEPNLLVVGEASNGQESVELSRKLKPEMILMDINLPVMNGIQATKIIKEEFPKVKIIAVSVNRDDATVRAILDAGAEAYVEKASCAQDLIQTINEVMNIPV